MGQALQYIKVKIHLFGLVEGKKQIMLIKPNQMVLTILHKTRSLMPTEQSIIFMNFHVPVFSILITPSSFRSSKPAMNRKKRLHHSRCLRNLIINECLRYLSRLLLFGLYRSHLGATVGQWPAPTHPFQVLR